MCRECANTMMNPHTRRHRRARGSNQFPIRPQSTCATSPGSGSGINTVTDARFASSGMFAFTYRRKDASDTASPRSSHSR